MKYHIQKLAPALLLVLRGAMASRTTEECLLRDDEHVSGATDMAELKGMGDGSWVDDGEVLLEEWAPGMGVRAVNYCIDNDSKRFLSMQLMVGDSEESDAEYWHALRKHGAAGGSCYRWVLKPDDYIRLVQYTWNWQHSQVV